uniref:Uncharacterized protein n=1 Tax=Anguilla anguilla TaxID=7936 RepID=A0A0E9RC70_ANGAN
MVKCSKTHPQVHIYVCARTHTHTHCSLFISLGHKTSASPS